jgi:acetyl esterase/lipase
MTRISYGSDPNHFGHLRLPAGAGPHPLVILIHGGFWRDRFDLSHMEPLAEALTRNGYATWSVEYRRTGQPGGGWPGTFEDVLAAVHFRARLAAQYPVDVARAVVIGFSAGGHLALCVAASDATLQGVISLAGVADLQMAWDLRLSDGVVREFLGALPDDVPEASPVRLSIRIPQRLIHGDEDGNVPIIMARQYVQAKQSEDAQLLEIAGMNHSDLVSPESRAYAVLKSSIAELLVVDDAA